ncbi:MAG: hypothetical protein ABSA57_13560 [Candidatus Acidiferrales bacterium]|jgi:hypothetical protein
MFLLAAAVMLASCRPQPPAPRKPALLGWRPIASWSGRGNIETDSFNIGSGQWRIKWETSHEQSPGKGAFRVIVHSLVSGRYVSTPVDHQGAGSGVAYVAEDPRQFFLVIESSGIDWKVSVEEGVVGE